MSVVVAYMASGMLMAIGIGMCAGARLKNKDSDRDSYSYIGDQMCVCGLGCAGLIAFTSGTVLLVVTAMEKSNQ